MVIDSSKSVRDVLGAANTPENAVSGAATVQRWSLKRLAIDEL
jgi:hypothetical protein